MQQLVKVVERFSEICKEEKYSKTMELIISVNKVIINYFIYSNNKKSLYKKLIIDEVDNKLKVTIMPERLERITDLAGLEDIILILEKQSNVKELTQEEVQQIKEKYVAGLKVELIKMYDLQAPPPKIRGFIDFVDDVGTLHIRWENGSTLGLKIGVDEFKIICPLCNQELEVF